MDPQGEADSGSPFRGSSLRRIQLAAVLLTVALVAGALAKGLLTSSRSDPPPRTGAVSGAKLRNAGLSIAGVTGSELTAAGTPAAHAQGSGPTLFVDQDSVGGPCSNSYSVAQAENPATPWCSMLTAVKFAPDGSTVEVRAGAYPVQVLHWPYGYGNLDSRADYVTFEPYGFGTSSPESVTINGIDLSGVTHLRFQGFHLVGTDATGSGFVPAAWVYLQTSYIQLLDNDVSGQGISIAGSANHVLVQGNTIHDLTTNCVAGGSSRDGAGVFFGGNDVQILNNQIVQSRGDALNMGTATNVVVANNTISTIDQSQDVCGYHVDLIQIENHGMGPITIANNLFTSGGEFILRNATGLTIENNVILQLTGFMQLMADPGARVVNNTWWGGCSTCGGLLLRDWTPGSSWTQPPFNYTNHMDGTIIENNVLRQLGLVSVALSEFHADYNIVTDQPPSRAAGGPHTIFGRVALLNPGSGQFALAPGSPGIDSADSAAAPATDMLGQAAWDDPVVPNTGIGSVTYRDRGAVELTPATGFPVFGLSAQGSVDRRSSRLGQFGVHVGCNLACTVNLQGYIAVSTKRGSGKGRRKMRRLALGPIRAGLSRGKSELVHLALSRKSRTIFRRNHEHGTVVIDVQARADDGQVATQRLTISVPLRLAARAIVRRGVLRRGKIGIRIRCNDPCSVEGHGYIAFGRHRRLRLLSLSAGLVPGHWHSLLLAVPSKLRSALAHHHGRGLAAITLRAQDGSGQVATTRVVSRFRLH